MSLVITYLYNWFNHFKITIFSKIILLQNFLQNFTTIPVRWPSLQQWENCIETHRSSSKCPLSISSIILLHLWCTVLPYYIDKQWLEIDWRLFGGADEIGWYHKNSNKKHDPCGPENAIVARYCDPSSRRKHVFSCFLGPWWTNRGFDCGFGK